jgi:amino acid adenylation domain-containing protein
MNKLNERIASLSPEKRALLEHSLQARKNNVTVERIEPRSDSSNTAPLSFAQQRLWFLDQLEPGLTFYNLPFTFNLNGPINVSTLERSLNEIVRRHEVLRSTFSVDAGQPIQVIHPEKQITLPVIDLADQSPEDRELEAARMAAMEALVPFDLQSDAMLRAKLLKISETHHVMLITMHHIASDGWSMGVLFRELAALYEAYSMSKHSPLPPLPIQYADFAVWQKNHLQGPRLEKLLQYWRSQLAGAPPILELPTDRPRPIVQVFQGATYVVTISKQTIDNLKKVAREADATLFMALLAAFKTLLFRYTDATDIVVGSPTANRTRIEVEGLIGFFVNPLVLRTDLSGNPSFLEVLKRVREVTLQAYENQELPFERLVEEIQPDRGLSHNPLFQVMFAMQNTEMEIAASLEDDSPQFRAGTSKFDLTLSATETTDGLTALFEYNTQLFDQATIATMAENFLILLNSISTEPSQSISRLLILGENQYRQLVNSDLEVSELKHRLVHQIFEAQVRRVPQRVAVEFLGESLTYHEVNQRANRVAHALRQRGLETGAVVGLCIERSFEMIIGVLAVLKAGGAYLPLDPTYPTDRLEFMLDDCEVNLVLTVEMLREHLPIRSQDVILLDSDWEQLAGSSDQDLTFDPPPDLVCLIYTSGSTGRPKGVMVTHLGICNSTESQERTFQIDQNHRILQFASLNFDASLFDMTMAWHCGATLCLAPQEDILPGHPLARLLEDQRISLLTIPPSALEVVPVVPLPDLRVLIVGGEVCLASLVSRWAPGRQMFNCYGPTEASIWCTVAKCQDNGQAPSIGRPILNTRIYVLDMALQPVPVGVPGELHISGRGVTRGYFGKPELTAERFLPDPFHNLPGAQIYKTGDRVRRLADGQIQYLGRIDLQVKIRGYRIELGEIEHEMLQHPGVTCAAADVVAGADNNQFLIGYFVEQSSSHVNPADLRDALRHRLPEYMVPADFIRLETFPLNSSGKLDRQVLQRIQTRTGETRSGQWVAPTNDTEKKIAKIWASILEIDRVGIHQGFFDLGGHSLLATRVASRLNEAFAIDLSLRAIFEYPTVTELALVIDELKSAQPRSDEIELVALSRTLVTAPEDVRSN